MDARPLLAGLLVALSGCAAAPADTPAPSPSAPDAAETVTVLADGLDTVWAIAFAPDGRVFLTERAGTVRVIHPDTGLDPAPWARVPAEETSETGLMGIALHPDFPDTPHVYLMYTYADGGMLVNKVVRMTEKDGRLADERVILDDIPGGRTHDGGRIAFGPDGKLYVTTGDATVPTYSQDPASLAGKVLRLNPDGTIPSDNPSADSPVYTLGHRNPQGIAFHPGSGAPYVSEHGAENHDEVNVLKPGANYGWPASRGDDDLLFEPAIWTSGIAGTLAPAGAAFIEAPDSPLDGAFAFVTLKTQHLHVLVLDPQAPTRIVDEHVFLEEQHGRLRALTWGPDRALYVGTSSADGRGEPHPDGDRVLRVPLATLERALG